MTTVNSLVSVVWLQRQSAASPSKHTRPGPIDASCTPTHVRFPYWTPNPSQRLWPRRGRSPRHAHIAELKHDDGLAEATSSQPPPAARSHLPHLHARLPAGRRVRTKRRLAERRRLGARQARTELLERHRRRRDAWAGMRFDVISMCMCCVIWICVWVGRSVDLRGASQKSRHTPFHACRSPHATSVTQAPCWTAVVCWQRRASLRMHAMTPPIVEEQPYYLLRATCY